MADNPQANDRRVRVNTSELRRQLLLAVNAGRTMPRALLGERADRRRNYNEEYGWPADESPVDQEVYQRLFERFSIAAKVVEVMARESWLVRPEVYEDENPEVVTPFEQAWADLSRTLRGQQSYFVGKEANPIWEYLRRADEISGVGRYGVLLLGLDDGLDLNRPAAGFEEKGSLPADADPRGGMKVTAPPGGFSVNRHGRYELKVNAQATAGRKLLYLRTLPESMATISKYETNPTSPRYGQPTEYNLSLSGIGQDSEAAVGSMSISQGSTPVHWSRCIHLADVHHQASPNETFAVPRMRPVLDHLLDLRLKLYGGCPEMYFQGAMPGLSFETTPGFEDADIDLDDMRVEIENYSNGLQRFLRLVGVTVRQLAPQVSDPTPQISVLLEAIAIKIGMPKRKLTGSERGSLASTQDDATWDDRLKERCLDYVSPRVIAPFVDRCIAVGVLPPPQQFFIHWPDRTSQTAQEMAAVTVAKTQALVQYVQGGVWRLMAPRDFFVGVMGYSPAEAQDLIDNAREQIKALVGEAHPLTDPTGQTLTPDEGAANSPAGASKGDNNPRPQSTGGKNPPKNGADRQRQNTQRANREKPPAA